MEELLEKIDLSKKSLQHAKAYFVMFTQEYANIDGLLQQAGEVSPRKILPSLNK